MIAHKTRFPIACVLYHGPDFPLSELQEAITSERIVVMTAESLLHAETIPDRPSVLIVDKSMIGDADAFDALPEHIVVVASDADVESALGSASDVSLNPTSTAERKLVLLRTAFQLSAARLMDKRSQAEADRTRTELTQLNRIGKALMMERDRDVLLGQILTEAMQLTGSDAGAIYILDEEPDGSDWLRFKVVRCESMARLKPFKDVSFPVDSTSLAGHVAKTKQPLIIPDAHQIPPEAPYRQNRMVEEELGYVFRSMLIIPMLDHLDEVVGVLHVANRKSQPDVILDSPEAVERYVIPYSDRDVQLGFSLAGQAAVSIENAMLYEQIEHIFESFVKAAVTAIDQRDPSTAGHSIRVAALTTDLAAALERSPASALRNVRFTRKQMRELYYAALLHDFGKVGVREEVLVKAKKLPPQLWERVDSRFDLIQCTMDLEYQRRRVQLMAGNGDSRKRLEVLDAEFGERMRELDAFRSAVRAANEPSSQPEKLNGELLRVAARQFTRPDGKTEPYLTPDELHFLQISCGTLDEQERLEVESHANQTLEFLSQIPWTEDLKNLPTFAASHHEKLNGSGYPRHLKGDRIPIQTRMLTIADMFDALTAADRPYKCAVSYDKALDILRADAAAGMLDRELVQVMADSQVYRRVLEEDWRRF